MDSNSGCDTSWHEDSSGDSSSDEDEEVNLYRSLRVVAAAGHLDCLVVDVQQCSEVHVEALKKSEAMVNAREPSVSGGP